MNALFGGAELDDLATPVSVRLSEAARAADRTAAESLADAMDAETVAVYGERWSILQDHILRRGGEAAHDRALRRAAHVAFGPFVREYAGASLRERIGLVLRRLRASGSTFTVGQDEERIRFTLDQWGAYRLYRPPGPWQREAPVRRDGHRLWYPTGGAGDRPGTRLSLTGPRDLTGGWETLPAFAATELLFYDLVPQALLGRPIAVVGLPADVTGTATLDVPRRPGESEVFGADELRRWETPTSVQVRDAAAAGDWERVDRLARRLDDELVAAKDPLSLLRTGLLTWIAREWGEAAVADALLTAAPVVMGPWTARLRELSPADSVRTWAGIFRAHGSTFDIAELDDVIVFSGVLGACGRMLRPAGAPRSRRRGRRIHYPSFGAYTGPDAFGLLQEPGEVTGGSAGHPVYGAHCHVFHELFARRELGRECCVELHDRARAGDIVCLFPKDDAPVPEHVVARFAEGTCRGRPVR